MALEDRPNNTVLGALFVALILGVLSEPKNALSNPYQIQYRATWGPLHAADIILTYQSENGHYSSTIDLRTRGLTDLLLGIFILGKSEGNDISPGRISPISYSQNYHSVRRSPRLLTIKVDPNSGKTQTSIAIFNPPTDDEFWIAEDDQDDFGFDESHKNSSPSIRVESDIQIPEELRIGTYDPLAAIEIMRRNARRGIRQFSIPVYDGHRRYQLNCDVGTVQSRTFGAQIINVLPVQIRFQTVAGFSSSHLKIWNDRVIELTLSADEQAMPLEIVSPGTFGITKISIVKHCSDGDPCLVEP